MVGMITGGSYNGRTGSVCCSENPRVLKNEPKSCLPCVKSYRKHLVTAFYGHYLISEVERYCSILV